MNEWVSCPACWAEFKVISESDELISYCPFCAEAIEHTSEDNEDEDYD